MCHINFVHNNVTKLSLLEIEIKMIDKCESKVTNCDFIRKSLEVKFFHMAQKLPTKLIYICSG